MAGGSSGDGGNGQRANGLIDESIALQTFQRRLVPEMINASSAHGAVLTALARDNPKLSASLSVTVDACLAFPRVPRACPGMMYRYVASMQSGAGTTRDAKSRGGTNASNTLVDATGDASTAADAGGLWVHIKLPSKPKRMQKPRRIKAKEGGGLPKSQAKKRISDRISNSQK